MRISEVQGEVAVEVDFVSGGVKVVGGGHDEQLKFVVGGGEKVCWGIELGAAKPSDLQMFVVVQNIQLLVRCECELE